MTTVDLAGLRPLVHDARVVALGEAAHNVTELHELRDQVLRMLVELGFTALVLESGFAEGLAVDAWVQGGPGAVEEVAGRSISYGFGHSAAVHTQLDWMREHGGLRFYGMDVAGGSTSPGSAVRELLARIEPAPGDADLLRRADLGGRVEAAVRYAGLTDRARRTLHADLRALAARGSASADPVAQRLAASVLAFAEGQDRDAFMAETVQWVLEREDRVLVGAHNGHVQRTPYDGRPTLGSLLSASLGSGLVVVGTTYASGPRVQITDRSDRPFDWSVSLGEDGPSPVLPADRAFDRVVALGEVHRVPGAFERLRREVDAPYPPTRTVDTVYRPGRCGRAGPVPLARGRGRGGARLAAAPGRGRDRDHPRRAGPLRAARPGREVRRRRAPRAAQARRRSVVPAGRRCAGDLGRAARGRQHGGCAGTGGGAVLVRTVAGRKPAGLRRVRRRQRAQHDPPGGRRVGPASPGASAGAAQRLGGRSLLAAGQRRLLVPRVDRDAGGVRTGDLPPRRRERSDRGRARAGPGGLARVHAGAALAGRSLAGGGTPCRQPGARGGPGPACAGQRVAALRHRLHRDRRRPRRRRPLRRGHRPWAPPVAAWSRSLSTRRRPATRRAGPSWSPKGRRCCAR